MNAHTLELQKSVVVAVAQAIPSAWERVIANYEVEDRADGRVENLIVVYVQSNGTELIAKGLEDAPSTVEKAFSALHEDSAPSADARWTTSEIVIDADRGYRFTFSFDPPKRINGVFDHDSLDKFDAYADIYRNEKEINTAGS